MFKHTVLKNLEIKKNNKNNNNKNIWKFKIQGWVRGHQVCLFLYSRALSSLTKKSTLGVLILVQAMVVRLCEKP